MLIGHRRIWNFLIQSVANGRLAHAYLFAGTQGVGKKTVAMEFVKNLLCENNNGCGKCGACQKIDKNQHPDILFVSSEKFFSTSFPYQVRDKLLNKEEGTGIKIEQVRQLQHQISLSPFCAQKKIVIIDGADQMTLEAANCLLKTLEEPPQKSLMILISSKSRQILPTIVSRCQLIKFLPVKSGEIADGLARLGFKNKNAVGQAVKFACGRPGIAINSLKDPDLWGRHEGIIGDLKKIQKDDLFEKLKYALKLSQDLSEANEILNDWLIWFRDRILQNSGLISFMVFGIKNASQDSLMKSKAAINNILDAQRLLSESSFNHRLVLENLMMKI